MESIPIVFCLLFLTLVNETYGGFRCGFLGSWSCGLSCKATGHTNGLCDVNEDCICSEEELVISKEIGELIDFDNVSKVISNRTREFADNALSWDIEKSIKKVIPSRCKISDSFCKTTCQAVGRKTGVCNSNKTDCDCDDSFVTAKQWALCVEDSICRLDCQRRGFSLGKCEGEHGWDCNCVFKNGGSVSNIEYVDEEFGPEEPKTTIRE